MDFWNDLYSATCRRINRISVKLFTLAMLIPILICFNISIAGTPAATANSNNDEIIPGGYGQTSAEANQENERRAATFAEADPAIISDIMQIRESLGGGLSKTLDQDALDEIGLGSLKMEFMHGFQSALEEVAVQKPTPAEAEIQDPSGRAEAEENEHRNHRSMNQVLPPLGRLAVEWDADLPSQLGGYDAVKSRAVEIAAASSQPRTLSKTYTKQEKTGLRNTARKLDQLAADLEDIEQFSFADQLRESASQMRTHARTPFTAENLPSKEKTLMR